VLVAGWELDFGGALVALGAQSGAKVAPIWCTIVSMMHKKGKMLTKTQKSQNYIKTQCSSTCLWGNLEPKWGNLEPKWHQFGA